MAEPTAATRNGERGRVVAQVLKEGVRARIVDAGLSRFATGGFEATTMAEIAADARTSVGNVYRYFGDKRALFDAAVPRQVVDHHDRLLDRRLATLVTSTLARDVSSGPALDAAADLLGFWIEHRRETIVLLDRAAGTDHAEYPARFVDRLVSACDDHVRLASRADHELLRIIFDNTRRAIVAILSTSSDGDGIRVLVEGFWAYQIPGLDGLLTWAAERAARSDATGP